VRRRFLVIIAVAAGVAVLPLAGCTENEFTFVQLCDTQLGMGGYEHDVATFKQAVVEINVLGPDFVIICGDLVDDTENDQAFAEFNNIKSGFAMPCYCVAGNHDVGDEPTVALLERYRRLIGPDWYKFKHKGHTFVMVNSQLWKSSVPEETARQDTWLRDTLKTAAEAGSPVFVAGHHPMYAYHPKEDDGYDNIPSGKRVNLLALFEQHNVVAVLSGHTHRQIVNDYRVGNETSSRTIQMVTSASTSRNFDGSPEGYRVWHIGRTRPYRHEYVALKVEAQTAAEK